MTALAGAPSSLPAHRMEMRAAGALLLLLSVLLLAAALLVTADLVEGRLAGARLGDERIATVLGGSKLDGSFNPDVIVDSIQQLRLLSALGSVAFAALGIGLLLRPAQCLAAGSRLCERLRRPDTRWVDYAFIAILAAAAFAVTMSVTRNGPGIDPDSVVYLTTAQHLARGEGVGNLVYWPPGYPLLVAAVMMLGLDAETAARLTGAMSLALSVLPLYIIGREIGGRLSGVLAGVIPLLLWPVTLVSVYAWSEAPYALFTLCSMACLTLLVGKHFERRERLWLLLGAALFAGLAALVRYIGVSIIAAVCLTVLFEGRRALKWRFAEAMACGLVAAAPLGLWVLRNVMATGTLAGQRAVSPFGPWHNAWAVARQIGNDFTSGDALGSLWPPAGILALVLVSLLLFFLIAVVLSDGRARVQLASYLRSATPVIGYVVLYLIALVGIASVWSFLPIYVRFLAPVYPFLVLLLLSFGGFVLCMRCIWSRRRLFLGTFAALMLLLTALQLPSAIVVRNGAEQGYSYNAPAWREARSLSWARETLPAGTVLFTNDTYALQLELPEMRSEWLPKDDEDAAAWLRSYQELAASPDAYALVFKEHMALSGLRHSAARIAELNAAHRCLVLVADFPEAVVWRAV